MGCSIIGADDRLRWDRERLHEAPFLCYTRAMKRQTIRDLLGPFAWTCIRLACGIAIALLLTSCGPRRYETVTCKDGSTSSGTGNLCAGHGGRA